MWKIATALVTLFCFSACTMLQPLSDLSGPALAAGLKPGDTVKVSTAEFQALELKVTTIDTESLRGVAPDGKSYTVPVASIQHLDRVVPDQRSTTWIVLGVLVVAVVAAIAGSGGGGSGGGGGY